MPRIDNFSLDNYRLDGYDKNAHGVLIKSGTNISSASSSSSIRAFDNPTTTYSTYYLQVSNQNFGKVPNSIIIKYAGNTVGLYVRDIKNEYGSLASTGGTNPLTVSDSFYVDENGFYLPVRVGPSAQMYWEAYG